MNDTSNIFHQLNQTVRLLSKKVNESLQQHDLYQSQWTILYCLKRFGPMTQTEVWQYLNVEAPTVTRTLKRLENNGWITRHKGTDQRARIVALTEKATRNLPAVEQTVRQFEQEMLTHLTQKERSQLLDLLQKVGMPAHTPREDDHHQNEASKTHLDEKF